MFLTQYLIRLDDACPTMDHLLWNRMESILDRYGVKPMVGVIPHNEDVKQQIDSEDANFWQHVKDWEQKGWTIAMHGYNHVYSSNEGGINPLWKKSEFAGHPIDVQRDKIKKGVAIMRKKGINPKYFFAPSHTFDENTLIALKEETDIRFISDTIASNPYKDGDFVYVPQQSGHPIRLPFGGLVTICYHPNTMKEFDFDKAESFIKDNLNNITSFDSLQLGDVGDKSFYDRLLCACYFAMRKIR